MATGIIGDIHLDLPALERTLAGPLARCDRLIVTGDFLDRGPSDADELLDRLLELRCTLLAGNHELAYLGGPQFANMFDDRSISAARRLRDLVLDGRLLAAAQVGNIICVHGGISRAYWQRELRKRCGVDPALIVRTINRIFLAAVHRRDYSHPLFGALNDRVRGPFWAHLHDDLLAPGLPPLRQAVGHVIVTAAGWQGDRDGAVYGLDWGPETAGGLIGHLLVEDRAGQFVDSPPS